jgi:Uma2 family endonuclease
MSRSDPFANDEMQIGQPTWRMALLFPPQGSWTEQEYLALDAGRQIEFDRGCVEVLDLPTKEHQRMVRFLFLLMESFVTTRRLGEVFFAPLPVRLWDGKYREPDLIFIKHGRDDFDKYPNGADLVIEIVSDSPGDRKRDLETKVAEYEMAGIQEYWVVDPQRKMVLLHHLVHSKYAVDAFGNGQAAHSRVLDSFSVDVVELFGAALRT